MKGRNERDFFIYFYDAMCSAKGNGLSDRRNRQKKKERNQEKKEKYSAPHQTDLTDPLADRSDKENKLNSF